MLGRPLPPSHAIGLDGAERSVTVVEDLAKKRFGSAGPPHRSVARLDWRALDDALSRAAERGAALPFWWRDDDAVAHTPHLDRLLALARDFDIPIALAAIPARVEPSLAARLAEEPLARVLVHGLAHANHALGDAKKAEFGSHRPLARLVEDAREGLRLGRRHFGDRLVPVFVPPWNRVAPDLVERLPRIGYRGLSTFGERRAPEPARALMQVNTHIDPIAWREGRGCKDIGALAAELAQAVASRAGSHGEPEPIGLLTHHLVHDEAVWRFVEELLSRMAEQKIMRFLDADAMFVGAQTLAT
jgi:hypothetical protein